ncbi:putative knottin, scorpion toxin [Medicago truncatula]|uniref:Defensin-like protein n=1 Tax=Medicago truncatula TaxID=3880 RepID=G7L967_MEDTR|nr:Defensin-like protein [Medicago truncatula]RHN39563.1 putative knottin, scorpion toxin [Medicago truncatula]
MTLSTASKFYIIFMFHCLLLISTWEVEATLCGRKSRTLSGRCTSNSDCSTKCIKWEYATYGSCGGFYIDCICFFNC